MVRGAADADDDDDDDDDDEASALTCAAGGDCGGCSAAARSRATKMLSLCAMWRLLPLSSLMLKQQCEYTKNDDM